MRGVTLHGRPYKRHFACFRCRKAYKQRNSKGQPPGRTWEDTWARPFPCPECGQPMADMGTDFKAPRRRDRDQWLKVAILHAHGVRFFWDHDHDGGPGYRPATLSQVEDYLVSCGFPREAVRECSRVIKAELAQAEKAEPDGE